MKRVKARVAVVVYRPSAKQGYSYNDEKKCNVHEIIDNNDLRLSESEFIDSS